MGKDSSWVLPPVAPLEIGFQKLGKLRGGKDGRRLWEELVARVTRGTSAPSGQNPGKLPPAWRQSALGNRCADRGLGDSDFFAGSIQPLRRNTADRGKAAAGYRAPSSVKRAT